MSVLSSQIKELREAARNIQGKLGRCLYRRKDVDEMQQIGGMLREAADTIERLRDRLHELQGVTGESRYTALFGTPERAARTLVNLNCDGSGCDGCSLGETMCDLGGGALLEWLREEGETE